MAIRVKVKQTLPFKYNAMLLSLGLLQATEHGGMGIHPDTTTSYTTQASLEIEYTTAVYGDWHVSVTAQPHTKSHRYSPSALASQLITHYHPWLPVSGRT